MRKLLILSFLTMFFVSSLVFASSPSPVKGKKLTEEEKKLIREEVESFSRALFERDSCCAQEPVSYKELTKANLKQSIAQAISEEKLAISGGCKKKRAAWDEQWRKTVGVIWSLCGSNRSNLWMAADIAHSRKVYGSKENIDGAQADLEFEMGRCELDHQEIANHDLKKAINLSDKKYIADAFGVPQESKALLGVILLLRQDQESRK